MGAYVTAVPFFFCRFKKAIMQFLDMKCRGKQKNTPLECKSRIGGPSLKTLMNHDFSKSSFIDIRLCPKCGWIKVTIENLETVPKMEVLGKKNVVIDFESPENVFKFMEIRR